MIVQCTVFEVQILKKPKLKNVVRNIKLILIKDFFLCSLKIQAKEHERKALIKPVIQRLHNPVSSNVYADSCTLLELPATPQNSLEHLFINNTAYLI